MNHLARSMLCVLLSAAATVTTAASRAPDAGEGPPPRLLPNGEPDIVAMIDDVVRHYHDEGLFNGSVLVTRDGETVYDGHYGFSDLEAGVPNAADTRYRLGSIGKQFTATAIMLLQQDGALDVHDTVATYLPDWSSREADRITLHQLLTHTSGFPRSVFDYVSGDISRTYTIDQLLRSLRRARLDFEPGTDYQYSNAGYTIVAAVVEAVSGRTHDAFVRERILEPAGLHETHFDTPDEEMEKDANGYVATAPGELEPARRISMSFGIGAGTYRTTTRDMARWDTVLRSGELLTAQSQTAMYTAGHDPDGDGLGYGYGWNVGRYERSDGHAPGTVISHDGGIDGFSTALTRRLDDREVIVVMSNRQVAPAGAIAADIANVLTKGAPGALARSGLRVVWRALQEDGVEAAMAAREELGRNERGVLTTAAQMVGPPDSVSRGSWGRCWFASENDGRESAELTYAASVRPLGLEVHGTAHQNGLTGVSLRDAESGEWFAASADLEGCGRTLKSDGLGTTTIPLDVGRAVDGVRLAIDNGLLEGTNVIDAVGLVAADGVVVWAASATAGSDRRHSAHALGFDPPTEDALNALGYTLLQSGRVDEAVAVFQLNVAAHPEAWNPHDSLGEGYMQRGQDELAVAAYERSLELNPDNANGRSRLEVLRRRARP